jgi:TPR repeat protein
MSADQGKADGQHNYGLCLERSKSIEVGIGEAARYYKLSADQGYPTGEYRYGLYRALGPGISVNFMEVAWLLTRSATGCGWDRRAVCYFFGLFVLVEFLFGQYSSA